MFMKTFKHSTQEFLPGEAVARTEDEVNTWVRTNMNTYKVMNISPPTQMFDWIIITVVYVIR